jgi:uncharacterized protein (DUF433 family)
LLPLKTGLYPVPLAAKLLHERPATVQRWAFGYRRRGTRYVPAIRTELPEERGVRVLTFLELVELMFIQGFLRSGLSWPKVREAARVAARLLKGEPHPFAMKRWFVDPATIYLKLGKEHGEEILVEVAGHAQLAIEPALRPYLQQLDFDFQGLAQRWFPLGFTTPVVVDPRRALGAPVTEKAGVPTEVVAALRCAGDSVSAIAAWYQMDESEVEAAVAFEEQLTPPE